MTGLVDEVCARLYSSGRAIEILASGLPVEAARAVPAPGKWSINEVLAHLADEERHDFRARIGYMLHQPEESWPAIDPERVVREGRFNDLSLDALRADFVEERRQSLVWLSGLRDADWSAPHHHPQMGDFTAASMLCAWAAHDLLHLHQIERILFQQLQRAAVPDRTDYAGTW